MAQAWVLVWAATGGRAGALSWPGRLLVLGLSTGFFVWLLRTHRRRWGRRQRLGLARASGALLAALAVLLLISGVT